MSASSASWRWRASRWIRDCSGGTTGRLPAADVFKAGSVHMSMSWLTLHSSASPRSGGRSCEPSSPAPGSCGMSASWPANWAGRQRSSAGARSARADRHPDGSSATTNGRGLGRCTCCGPAWRTPSICGGSLRTGASAAGTSTSRSRYDPPRSASTSWITCSTRHRSGPVVALEGRGGAGGSGSARLDDTTSSRWHPRRGRARDRSARSTRSAILRRLGTLASRPCVADPPAAGGVGCDAMMLVRSG